MIKAAKKGLTLILALAMVFSFMAGAIQPVHAIEKDETPLPVATECKEKGMFDGAGYRAVKFEGENVPEYLRGITSFKVNGTDYTLVDR